MESEYALYKVSCNKCDFQDTVEASNVASAEDQGKSKHKNHDAFRTCSGKIDLVILDENWK